MKKIKLSKEYTYDGKKYKELEVDFDSLTGADVIAAEAETMAITGRPTIGAIELNKAYQGVMVAKAAKLPVDFLQTLSAKDYSNVTLEASNFLLGSKE